MTFDDAFAAELAKLGFDKEANWFKRMVAPIAMAGALGTGLGGGGAVAQHMQHAPAQVDLGSISNKAMAASSDALAEHGHQMHNIGDVFKAIPHLGRSVDMLGVSGKAGDLAAQHGTWTPTIPGK